ncbi:hypothetical protein ACFYWX_40570 [Streptomyces sp. NPDC002888]|uniref:hypothetical protein n=1 Tax=Streptomyces sp. NPDC002888 TaxID=3364668 RepID=UPI0036AF4DCD
MLIEIPVAFLLGLTSVIRGWGRADEQTVAPPVDWVPILWLGGFTSGVLVIAVIFLFSGHSFGPGFSSGLNESVSGRSSSTRSTAATVLCTRTVRAGA